MADSRWPGPLARASAVRCHYLSDLHLESQEPPGPLPAGDVLLVAGDLCHAACLEPMRTDPYAARQRERVARFAEAALASFAHVLLVPGNHDHYDGTLEDTAAILRRRLPGITVLDDEAVRIGDTWFFGSTLWSDFEGGRPEAMEKVRRGLGEYFFVRTRSREAPAGGKPAKLRPEDVLAAHQRALAALRRETSRGERTVVVTHHAPSRKGLNPFHAGNGLDGAYASDLESLMAGLADVPVWVHGHTHIRRRYRVGDMEVRANCRGFAGKDSSARAFSPDAWFDL